jgi:hypothetical protein
MIWRRILSSNAVAVKMECNLSFLRHFALRDSSVPSPLLDRPRTSIVRGIDMCLCD